ncbi:MAG: type II CAAX endopeptidase family protein [Bacilli bacterium]
MFKKTNYEQIKKDLLDLSFGFGAILLYYTAQYFAYIPIEIFNLDINKFSYTLKTIYLLFFQLITLGLLLLVFKKKIIAQFKDFHKNKKTYFNKYFKYWFLLLIGMMLSNLIIMLINNGKIANNEQGIRDIFDKNPLYVYITGVLIAPFVEEIVFRLSLHQIFKTKWLFITISGLFFGLAHLIGQTETLMDCLYLIPYSIPGFIFAYIFIESKNIFVSISMHIFHNGFFIALQIFMLLFG